MAILDQLYADAIKGFEGYAPNAAWDYKQYTNGYGTKALYPGESIDKTEAENRFNTAIEGAAKTVDTVAPNAPPGVRAALISLTYNAGSGWANSGLGEAVKAGDWKAARDRFLQYNKAGGQVNPGLVNRRQAEAAWFNPDASAQVAQPPQEAPLSPTQMAQAPSPKLPAFGFTPQIAGPPSPAPQSAPPLGAPPQPQMPQGNINIA